MGDGGWGVGAYPDAEQDARDYGPGSCPLPSLTRRETTVGDDAERAEDGWWELSPSERARIEREIEQEGDDHLGEDPWRRDDREREERVAMLPAPRVLPFEPEHYQEFHPFSSDQHYRESPAYRAFVDRYIIPRGHSMIQKSPAQLQAELAVAQAQLATLQAAEAAAPSRWPAEPPVGTVIRFRKVFPSNRRGQIEPTPEGGYTYVAVRTERMSDPWFLTGRMGRENLAWPRLCEKIGDVALCEIATEWFEVPPLEPAEPEPAQDVGAFVDMFFARTAEPEPVELDVPGDGRPRSAQG